MSSEKETEKKGERNPTREALNQCLGIGSNSLIVEEYEDGAGVGLKWGVKNSYTSVWQSLLSTDDMRIEVIKVDEL